jgi:para-nitrobenzyl esterase
MKTKMLQLCAAAMLLAAQAGFAQVVVKIDSGLVAGDNGDIASWKGIPYAQPPVGDLRWRPPQPIAPWQGIRHATDFGPMCPQGDPAHLKPDMNEDCLSLNVWSGAKSGDKLPVLVWIHGGGFGGGSGRMDGAPLARLGMVVVSINYRLGMLGFMAHPELTRESPHRASGNYGLMDQISALQWVQRNITVFGGDPRRVTIGGSSAGGTSVGYLIASPLAKGLFEGAWLDSASRLFLPDPALNKTVYGLTPMEQVGLKVGPHIQELRALSTSEVMLRGAQATDALYGEGGSGKIGLKPESHVHMPNTSDRPWWAFTDGYVMPVELAKMFASGRFNHAACLVGSCKDEGLSFTRHMPDLTVDGYKEYLRKYYSPVNMKMFEMYPGATADEIRESITRSITDYMFLYGSIRTAEYEAAVGQHVYVERFLHVSPGAGGVLHGADAAYFRGDVRAGVKYGPVLYGPSDEALSDEMMKLMAAFVKNQSPNINPNSPQWPAWTPQQPQYLAIGDKMEPRTFEGRDQALIHLFREQLGQ